MSIVFDYKAIKRGLDRLNGDVPSGRAFDADYKEIAPMDIVTAEDWVNGKLYKSMIDLVSGITPQVPSPVEIELTQFEGLIECSCQLYRYSGKRDCVQVLVDGEGRGRLKCTGNHIGPGWTAIPAKPFFGVDLASGPDQTSYWSNLPKAKTAEDIWADVQAGFAFLKSQNKVFPR